MDNKASSWDTELMKKKNPLGRFIWGGTTKNIQTSHLLHFKVQIEKFLDLPKCLTNQFCDQN